MSRFFFLEIWSNSSVIIKEILTCVFDIIVLCVVPRVQVGSQQPLLLVPV